MEPALPPPAQRVLDFWFGVAGSETFGTQRAIWFQKDDATDEALRTGFRDDVEAALAGGLTDWDFHPRGRLARILLLDQFTRNIFRNTPRAFAGDARALAAARQCVDDGSHLALLPVERIFVYMPFEHAEDAAAQARAVALFRALDAAHDGFSSVLDYALRHQTVINRFGRFPHRNAILGRESTAEERAFLAQPGSGF